jgi:nucleotide-binding universal stress UspA family protein
MNGTVVVGVDGTTTSLDALDVAIDEALRRSSTLLIAHASETPSPRTGSAVVRDAAARARERSDALEIQTRCQAGPAGRYLTGLSESAVLLVVGSSELSGLAGLLAGSVSVYVAAHARCPVLVVPVDSALRQAPESPGTIVVGVDPCHSPQASIDFALEEATLRQVDVQVVIAASGLSDADRAHAAELACEWNHEWASARPARAAHAEQVDLPPEEALVAASEEAGLLVLGSRAQGDRLGSVGGAMLKHAFCPVAIVPALTGAAR